MRLDPTSLCLPSWAMDTWVTFNSTRALLHWCRRSPKYPALPPPASCRRACCHGAVRVEPVLGKAWAIRGKGPGMSG
jgi:hypothetical protein